MFILYGPTFVTFVGVGLATVVVLRGLRLFRGPRRC